MKIPYKIAGYPLKVLKGGRFFLNKLNVEGDKLSNEYVIDDEMFHGYIHLELAEETSLIP
ncbi:hypothetical protein [Photorhabdus sp. CRCIA-P01]|uniref:hypothetical protein n=1 Tax=Photorhabdus sp. CRCIA-P01 TaxID=2019570 RepID=UPI000E59C3AF|nr:hypothetical protein [Photorhabdus sp. CRCIA-P01]